MATVTDDFDRADNSDISSGGTIPWVQIEDSVSVFQVVSSGLRTRTSSTDRGVAYYNQDFENNQRSQIDYGGITLGGHFTGPAVRVSSGSTTDNATLYGVMVDDGGTPDVRLLKFINTAIGLSAATEIGSAAYSAASGDSFEIEASASTIRILVNSAMIVSVVDSAITSGMVGICAPNVVGFTLAGEWDNWEGGDTPGTPDITETPLQSAGALDSVDSVLFTFTQATVSDSV